ncbi:MAG: response regulator [Patescibacteria group bacterium]|nr:response regulator [Patescibacteria group bacterium]MDD4610860.1 response regulator [Patescibacteria group bacterium]
MARTNVMKSSKGRILFVEDEKNLVDMYHDFFEKNGYDFMTTSNIKEALSITEFEQPDIVLLDIIIPKEEKGVMNMVAEQGYEYLRVVKKNRKIREIPILMFTNLDTEQDRKKSEKMGAAAYIFKRDVTPQEVLDTIEMIIGGRRRR